MTPIITCMLLARATVPILGTSRQILPRSAVYVQSFFVPADAAPTRSNRRPPCATIYPPSRGLGFMKTKTTEEADATITALNVTD